jgi:MOSC domain-containing protein YiiM
MNSKLPDGSVLAVCLNPDPGIPKHPVDSIRLLKGQGVEGDYHAGEKVRHRYLEKKDPELPNIRHVLLIDNKIFGDLSKKGIKLTPGQMGENIVFSSIDVMSLELGTKLTVGEAVLEISEVRDPCHQLNESHPDLFEAVIHKIGEHEIYTAGVFARVIQGGKVEPGSNILIHI